MSTRVELEKSYFGPSPDLVNLNFSTEASSREAIAHIQNSLPNWRYEKMVEGENQVDRFVHERKGRPTKSLDVIKTPDNSVAVRLSPVIVGLGGSVWQPRESFTIEDPKSFYTHTDPRFQYIIVSKEGIVMNVSMEIRNDGTVMALDNPFVYPDASSKK